MIFSLKFPILFGLLFICNSLNLGIDSSTFNSKSTTLGVVNSPRLTRAYFDPSLSNYYPNFRLQSTFKAPKGLALVKAESDYECSRADWKYLNHSYLAYEGAKHTETICQSLTEGVLYRLAGGGSIKKEGEKCTIKAIDTNVADQSLCSEWIIEEFKIVKGVCPAGSAVAVSEDASDHLSYMCVDLAQDEEVLAHVGHKGCMRLAPKIEGGCGFFGWSPNEETTSTLCVVPQTFVLRLTPSKNEGICGSGKSLMTMLEMLDDIDFYCSLIPASDDTQSIRLSGGAILSKLKNICFFVERESSHTDSAFCADIDR